MDRIEKYVSLFPMEVEVTKEIIEEGLKCQYDSYRCLGVLTLAKGLGDNVSLVSGGLIWGTYSSETIVGDEIMLTSSYDSDGKEVNMMEITEPCTITLKH